MIKDLLPLGLRDLDIRLLVVYNIHPVGAGDNTTLQELHRQIAQADALFPKAEILSKIR